MDGATAQEVGFESRSTTSAFRHVSSHLRFWLVGTFFLGLDLWSKHWIFDKLEINEIRPVLWGLLDFRQSLNAGAVFGSFTGQTAVFIIASVFAIGFVLYLFAGSSRYQRSLHVALALILSGALGNLYDRAFVMADVVEYRTDSGRSGTTIGTIKPQPNEAVVHLRPWPDGTGVQTFDRNLVTTRRQGVVRDFIKFVPRFPTWMPKFAGKDIWPWVFNVADASLVCGVLVLLMQTWLCRRSERPTK